MCQTLQKVTARFHYEVQQVLQSVTVNTEAYLEPCKTSIMKYFEKIFNDLNPLTIFIKSAILADWQSSKYVPAILPLLCLETLSYIICYRDIVETFSITEHNRGSLTKYNIFCTAWVFLYLQFLIKEKLYYVLDVTSMKWTKTLTNYFYLRKLNTRKKISTRYLTSSVKGYMACIDIRIIL